MRWGILTNGRMWRLYLYRLLFLLYAEDRDLLPRNAEPYASYSLYRLQREVNQHLREGKAHPPMVHRFWGELTNPFALIDEGFAEGSIPAYNGGLFSPTRYPHVAHTPVGAGVPASPVPRWEIGDHRLAEVIDLLAYERDRWNESGTSVGPLADEAARQVAQLRPEVDRGIRKLERTRREWEKSSAADAAQHVADLRGKIEAQKRRLLEPYLSLKILDPAMGSGHFLVGAADFLSLAMATDPNLPDVTEDEDPQTFYKRLVVERCLYGVDLNPLAVELAKLSLWLHTVSKDKALSFLDHHLRCGNSLIGARVEDDLMREPPQVTRGRKRKEREGRGGQLVLGFTDALTATHLQYFLDTFREIMETPSGDAATERRKDELYRAMDAVRDKFRAVAHYWLALFFGVPVIPQQYERAVNALRGTDAEWQALIPPMWFQDAQDVAHDKRFFHWELEFPEVFFDAHGFKPKEERGFDAVIGNPPYGGLLSQVERGFTGVVYESSGSTFDVFGMFVERGTLLLKQRQFVGMIVPSGWLTAREHVPHALRRT